MPCRLLLVRQDSLGNRISQLPCFQGHQSTLVIDPTEAKFEVSFPHHRKKQGHISKYIKPMDMKQCPHILEGCVLRPPAEVCLIPCIVPSLHICTTFPMSPTVWLHSPRVTLSFHVWCLGISFASLLLCFGPLFGKQGSF